jgi:O-antigen/teichoic acid export membrane protein
MVLIAASVIEWQYNRIVMGRHFVALRFTVDRAFWRTALTAAWPFALSSVLIKFYYDIDKVMLSTLMVDPDVAVGLYTAATRLVMVFAVVPLIVGQVLFPVMSRAYGDGDDRQLEQIFRTYVRYMVFLGIPLGIGAVIVMGPIVGLILGDAYRETAPVAHVLIWSVVLIFLHAPFDRVLQATHNQVLFFRSILVAAVVNVGLNLFLIPSFGIMGAAVATVLTECTVLLLEARYCYCVGVRLTVESYRQIAAVLGAGIAMALTAVAIGQLQLGPLAAATAAVLVYLAVAWRAGAVGKEEMRSMWGLLG